MTSGIDPEAAAAIAAELADALPMACELFDLYWEMSLALRERIGTWGDDAPAYYLAAGERLAAQLRRRRPPR